MSRDDDLAKAAVLSTLQDPKLSDVEFGVGLYDIDASSFAPVTSAIRRGKITVKYDANLGQIAYYNHARNEIEIGFKSAANVAHQGLIVHECVHAAMDAQHHKFEYVDHLTTEAAGYIAQCLFVIAKIPPAARHGSRLTGPDAVTDKIFRAAWNIALAEFNGDLTKSSDFIDLENGLKNHPLYSHNIHEVSGYDGVHKKTIAPQNAGHGHTH